MSATASSPLVADPPACPWAVGDYATARAALTHPGLTRSVARTAGGSPLQAHVLNLEGSDHRRMRSALDSAIDDVTPRTFRYARETAIDLISGLDGEVDAAGRLVRPLVLLVLDRLLGLSDGTEADLRWWHDAALACEIEADPTNLSITWDAVCARLADLIEARRRDPRDDVVSILAARRDLPDDERLATIAFCLNAGYVNTVNFLGLALLALARHPAQFAWLRAHPGAAPDAVEELLRYAEPVERASMRIAAYDLGVAGRPVAAGTVVNVFRGSVGRDPARYENPDRLDFRRSMRGSLAFGAGAHYCVAAGLVRVVADLTLVTVLDRFTSLACTEKTPLDWDFATPLWLSMATPS